MMTDRSVQAVIREHIDPVLEAIIQALIVNMPQTQKAAYTGDSVTAALAEALMISFVKSSAKPARAVTPDVFFAEALASALAATLAPVLAEMLAPAIVEVLSQLPSAKKEKMTMKLLVGYEWPEGRSKQVTYISQDRHIRELVVGIGGTWQQADLTMLAGAPSAMNQFLVGYAWPEGGTKQVAYLGPDGHIHELSVSVGGNWQCADLSAITGAPSAVQVTTGYSCAAGHSKQVVFVGDDDHIHELVVEMDRPWRHVDLTTLTSAPIPGSKCMVGYQWARGQCQQIAYVGQDGHIHELCLEAGKMWQHADLTALTNAPRATDLMVGYEWPEGQCKQVAFVGEDHHIHELCLVAGNAWKHADLSALTNAPLAMDVLTGYAWSQGRMKQIAYVGQDGHIHELCGEIGETWRHVDLTEMAHAPIIPIASIVGYAWSSNGSKQVAYVGNDGDIRELWMPLGGQWAYADLSQMVMALPVWFS